MPVSEQMPSRCAAPKQIDQVLPRQTPGAFPCRIDVRDRLDGRPFRAHARRPWMEPFKMKQDEHFIIERKSIELLIAAPETCRFLVARLMLT